MSFGTLLTLFVVPTVYTLLGARHEHAAGEACVVTAVPAVDLRSPNRKWRMLRASGDQVDSESEISISNAETRSPC